MRLKILISALLLTACGDRNAFVPIPSELLEGSATVCGPGYTASVMGACMMALRENETILLDKQARVRAIEKARQK